MIKRIAYTLFIAAIFVFSAVLFFKMVQSEQNKNNLFAAIPNSSFAILKVDNITEFWQELHTQNLVWQNIQTIASVREKAIVLDSIFSENNLNEQATELINKLHKTISWHAVNQKSIEWFLAIAPKNSEIQATDFGNLFTSKLHAKPIESYTYNDAEITKYSTSIGKLYGCYYKGFLFASPAQSLTEAAVRKLYANESFQEQSSFRTVAESAGKFVNAQLYINAQHLSEALKITSNTKTTTLARLFTWGGFDVDLQHNTASFNGFVHLSDSTKNYLSIFQQSDAQEFSFADILPHSTLAYFTHFGFSNFNKFHSQLMAHYRAFNEEHSLATELKAFNAIIEENSIEKLSELINNEVLYTRFEPLQDSTYWLAIAKMNDEEYAKKTLVKWSEKSQFQHSEHLFQDSVGPIAIHAIETPNLQRMFFSRLFPHSSTTYFAFYHEFLIMAPEPYCIKRFFQLKREGLSLAETTSFNEMKSKLSSDANLFVYANLGPAIKTLHQELHKNLQIDALKLATQLEPIDALAAKFTSESKDLLYVEMAAQYNNNFKTPIQLNWQVLLDTVAVGSAHPFTNHYTNQTEFLVQDALNQVYLISANGKVLWKYQAKAPVLSSYFSVDAFKNNKLQIVFNTATELHCLDRNGNSMQGFPVTLPNSASGPMQVLDYNNSRNYRLLVPTEKTILNYNLKGKRVKGWKNATSTGISSEIKYLYVQGKDYLCGHDSLGNFYCFNRSGETRIKSFSVDAKLSYETYRLIGSAVAEQSLYYYLDSARNYCRVLLNGLGNKKLISNTDVALAHNFIAVNSSLQPYLISIDYNGYLKAQTETQTLWEHFIELDFNTARISELNTEFICLQLDNNCLLFDVQGSLLTEMPIKSDFQPLVFQKRGERDYHALLVQGNLMKLIRLNW